MKIIYSLRLFSTCILTFLTTSLFADSQIDSLLNAIKTESDQKKLANAHYQVAIYYTNHAEYQKSEMHLNESFQIYNSMKDEFNIMGCYLQYGILESFRGNYPRSASFFLRTLLYADRQSDSTLTYAIYINLASVYSALEDYKKAKYYLSKIDVRDLEKDFNLQINYLGNMGQIEFELGNYNSALKYLEKGISLFDINSPEVSLIQLLILTGDCATKLSHTDKAIKYYDIAFNLSKQGDFPVQLAHLYYGYSVAYQTLNPNKALTYSDSSLKYAKQYEVLDLVANLYKLKSDIYNSIGNNKLALQYYKEYDVANDSVFSMESKQDIDILEANYEVEKSKNYIEKLTLANQKDNLQKTIYILSTIATIIVVIILIYFLRRRNLLNRKLNNSNKVKDKLLSIIAHDLKSPLHNISSVLGEIENNTFDKEEQSKIIQSLTSQTDITVETLENLLKWGQSQLKGISVTKVDFELKKEILKNIELFQAQLINKNIKINVDIATDYSIFFDKDHFDFILRNLIGNAIKFSFTNSEIQIYFQKLDKKKIKLIVQDYGTGILKSDINTIFQATPTIRLGTNNEKGSGLGLALCREFAEANGASIGFESIESKGTSFYLIIKTK